MTGMGKPGDQEVWVYDAATDSWVASAAVLAGGGGADVSASYVTVGNTGSLPNERALVGGYGISLLDGGAGDSLIISVSGSLSGSATGSSGWQTAFDIDFTTVATSSFTADGTGSMGGLNWTFYNMVNADAIGTTPGVGLIIDPNANSSDFYTAVWTAPSILLPITRVIPDFNLRDYELRTWIICETTGADSNYEGLRIGISGYPASAGQYAISCDAVYDNTKGGLFYAVDNFYNGSVDLGPYVNTPTYNFFMIDWRNMLDHDYYWLNTSPTSSFDQITGSMKLYGTQRGLGGTNAIIDANLNLVTGSSDVALFAAALTVNTTNSFQATIRRWKLEYRSRASSVSTSTTNTTTTTAGGADVSASYVTVGNTGSLPNERALTAGTGISITDYGPGNAIVITATGVSGSAAGGADVSASYVTLGNTGSLPNERALVAGYGLSILDGGPNDSVIISFTGSLSASSGPSSSGSDGDWTTNIVSGSGGGGAVGTALATTSSVIIGTVSIPPSASLHIITPSPNLTEDFDTTPSGSLPSGWSSDGNALWYASNLDYVTAPQSAQGGNIGDSQNTNLYWQVNVPYPSQLMFQWKVDSETNFDFLHFYIDGVEAVTAISGQGAGWQQVTASLQAAGTHTYKWSYIKDSSNSVGNDTGWVDNVQLIVQDAVGLIVESGSVGIGTQSPASRLHVVGNSTLEGDVAVTGVISGALYVNDVGAQFTVGAGSLSGTVNPFGDSIVSGTMLLETTDGWNTPQQLSGSFDKPVNNSRPVTIGHPMMFASGTSDSPSLFVKGRNVSWLETFANQNALPGYFLHDGNAHWFLDTLDPTYAYGTIFGRNVMRSGHIAGSQSSSILIKRNLDVETRIAFAYRVSSESGFDYLHFYIDDAQQNQWSGDTGWGEFTSSVIPAGEHVFRWSYSKDPSGNVGLDSALVDHIQIIDLTASSSLSRRALIVTEGQVGIGTETPASGVLLHVSGGLSEFDGDVQVSGTLTVGTGSVKLTSNDIQFSDSGTRIERSGSDLVFYDTNNPTGKLLADLAGYWTLSGSTLITSMSVVSSGSITSTRRTPTDASTAICWAMDESAAPFANSGTGTAQALTGTYGSVNAGMTGLFSSAAGFGGSAGLQTGDTTEGEDTSALSVSAWVYLLSYTSNGEFIDKKYQTGTTWLSPYACWNLSQAGSNGIWQAGIAFAGTRQFATANSQPFLIPLNVWTLLSFTYDTTSGNLYAYINGSLAQTTAIAGNPAIDYGSHGPYQVGAVTTQSSQGSTCIMDDIRIEPGVVRSQDYYRTMYRRGLNLL